MGKEERERGRNERENTILEKKKWVKRTEATIWERVRKEERERVGGEISNFSFNSYLLFEIFKYFYLIYLD